STAFNPVHIYPTIGTYNVTLTTYNIASGCRDTSHAFIKLDNLADSMHVYHSSLCRDVSDTFAAIVIDMPFVDSSWVIKYKWYFDGLLTDTVLTIYQYDTAYHNFHTSGLHAMALVLT